MQVLQFSSSGLFLDHFLAEEIEETGEVVAVVVVGEVMNEFLHVHSVEGQRVVVAKEEVAMMCPSQSLQVLGAGEVEEVKAKMEEAS